MDLSTIIIVGALALSFIYSLLITFAIFSDEYSFAGIVLRIVPFTTLVGAVVAINGDITEKEFLIITTIAVAYSLILPLIKRKK